MKFNSIVILVLLAITSLANSQADPLPEEQSNTSTEVNVEEGVAQIRKEKEERRQWKLQQIEEIKRINVEKGTSKSVHPASQGAVYQPSNENNNDLAVLRISNVPAGNAAELYSDIKGKEVMISSRVSGLRLNIDVGECTRTEAIEIFEKEFAAQGIQIVNLDEQTIALIKSQNR